MQHETSRARRGSASTSSTSPTPTANTSWSAPPRGCATRPTSKFLLTAGFFETHRPYPHDRYEPADAGRVDAARLPARHPGRAGRTSPTSTARSPSPTPRSGELLDALDETGLDREHLGGLHDRPRPRAAAREVHAVRRGHRHRDDRPAAAAPATGGRGSTTTCSAAWTCCPRCWNCWACRCPPKSTAFRTREICWNTRGEVRSHRGVHDEDLSRFFRSRSERSGPRNTATSRITRSDRCSTCPGTSRRAHPGRRWRRYVDAPRPERELYDLVADPTERNNLLITADDRQGRGDRRTTSRCCSTTGGSKTNDVIPSDFAGTRISERYTADLCAHQRHPVSEPVGRSPPNEASKPNNRNSLYSP